VISSSNILNILGILNLLLAGSMLTPLLVNWIYGEPQTNVFLFSIAITGISGLLMMLLCKRTSRDFTHREGFAIVAFGWIDATLFGALPYLFSGTLPVLVDACFETASGFTTTGSTVLTNVEAASHAILFWRCLTQWLGGMGIILLSMAILPYLGIGGMQLYKAEVPGPAKADKITPRITQTARILWLVYVGISFAQVIMLLLGGMNLFDSICHTFTTMATGGFSPKNISIEFYQSDYIEFVITFFMFVAGANFALHYRFLKGDLKAPFRDDEFRFYFFIVAVSTFLIMINLYWVQKIDLYKAFRWAIFQVVSIQTTTGYSSIDFEKWPAFSQFMLLLLMLVGGCAGSTGGAIKVVRIYVLTKQAINELHHLVHPHGIRPVKIGGKVLSSDTLHGIWGLSFLYMAIFFIASLAISLLGSDMITSISAVAATLGNVGPGLGEVGPADNFAHLSTAAKWILTACMLVGRLEVYTLLLLLLPEFWRK
jgi:trk system potassium uptake protein